MKVIVFYYHEKPLFTKELKHNLLMLSLFVTAKYILTSSGWDILDHALSGTKYHLAAGPGSPLWDSFENAFLLPSEDKNPIMKYLINLPR